MNFKQNEELIDKAINREPENIFKYMTGNEFSMFMHNLLLDEDEYIIDTGNYENVNFECAWRLQKRIKKHPIIWRLFFKI